MDVDTKFDAFVNAFVAAAGDYKSQLKLDIDAYVAEQVAIADAAAFKRGQDSMVLPGTGTGVKEYTQDEVDLIVVNTKAEVTGLLQPQIDKAVSDLTAAQAQVDSLTAQVADLQGKLDVINAGLDAQAQEKFVALKADLKAKYDELQVVESQAETGFDDLLK